MDDGQFKVFVRDDAVISKAPVYYVLRVFKFRPKITGYIFVTRQVT